MSKKEIVERLFKAGHIDFDEALELMAEKRETIRETHFIIQPYTLISQPQINPFYPNRFTQPYCGDPLPGHEPINICTLTVGENVIPLTFNQTIN